MARLARPLLELPLPATWGGCRRGAGRKPNGPRPALSHLRRETHDVRCPVHVTLRCHRDVPSLRRSTIFPKLRAALAAANRADFRVVHFSVQLDHLHLIVEADRASALTRGIRGLAVRCALAINRAAKRHGPVWSDRYHTHTLGTPREVRHGLVYVLLNFRKHLRAAPRIDPCSSGPWFDGWAHPHPKSIAPCPVATPRTWLLAIGWRHVGGPIDWHEAPARAVSS